MCFSAAEAAFLSRKDFDNLLVAYPTSDRAAVAQLCLEIEKGKKIYLMVDSLAQAELLDSVAASHQVVLPLCLDMDMSSDYPGLHFGVWRSPLSTPEQVMSLARQLRKLPNVELRGLMGYEAQIAGVGDNSPGQKVKNRVIQTLKQRSFKSLTQRRQKAVKLLEEAGFQLDFVNGGGTGSLELTRQDSSCSELTVGSGFYAPTLFDNYKDFRHLPAAAFAIPVVRQPLPNIYTCLGGGYIASGATGPEKQPQVYLPEGGSLFALEGAGEVQTPVRYSGTENLQLGDPIFLRHSKAGELCEHFNELFLVSGHQIIDVVKTYRGEGQCFL